MAQAVVRILPGRLPTAQRPFGCRLLGVAMLAAVCIFFLPSAFFLPAGFGLEASWRLVLNKAFSEHWVFGEQLVWTYGPLGFLESRLPYGVSRCFYLGFDALLMLLFLRLTVDAVKEISDRLLAFGCLAFLLVSKKLINVQPSSALYCVLIYLVVRNLRKPNLVDSAALVVTSVALFFFKMNFGLVGVFLCCLVCLFMVLEKDKVVGLWLGIVGLQILLAWLFAPPLHVNLIAYVKSSLALVGQYSDGMAVGPGRGGVAHFVVCLFFASYVGWVAAFVWRRGLLRGPLIPLLHVLVGGVAIFVLYKTAIVRSDYLHHNTCFIFGFPVIALAFVLHAPQSLRRFWRLLFIGSTTYASLLLTVEHGDWLIYTKKDDLKAFFPVEYLKGLKEYNRHVDWKAYIASVRDACPDRSVPEEARQLVGTNSVEVFPYETTLVMGSGLTYQPRPIPQTYAVMGKELEARNLAFFESSHAPQFVMYVLGEKAVSIDDRYHLWDEPAIKRLLQENYEPRLVFTNLQGAVSETEPKMSPVLLLERKYAVSRPQTVPVSIQTERNGKEFALPECSSELYARIGIRKTLLGRLVSFIYRGATVRAHFWLEDGTEKEFRVLSANLENGVLVNHFAAVSDADGTRNFLCHRSSENLKCLKVRIDFEHSWEYKREFEVAYFHRAP